jgi:hypothetical protein
MFIVYHVDFPHQDKRWFKTHAGARRSATCSNRHLTEEKYKVVSETDFENLFPVTMKTVRNLMTGELMEIPSNTPHCCDPSRETFWST